LYIASRTYLR